MADQLSLMGIYAHPDDEQGVTGSLAKYGRQGVKTTLVVATRGEEGEIAPGVKATPATLGQVREQEMRCAAKTVGVDKLYFLDYCDSGMAGTPANATPTSFHLAPLLGVAEKVTALIRRERPQVILTFEPYGGYGHPDHIKIHQAALISFFLAPDPHAFEEQITQDGLEAWAPAKLYYGTFSRADMSKYVELIRQSGQPVPELMQNFLKRGLADDAITARIDTSDFAELKLKSLLCHASQLGPDTFFAKLPPEFRLERNRQENFVLAESRLERPAELETDLFQGIR